MKFFASGVDINTSDQVTQLHFGTNAAPICTTAPTANQHLIWTGTQICASGSDSIMTTGVGIGGNNPTCVANTVNCPIYLLTNAHTLTRIVVNTSTAPAGCSPNASFGVLDITSSTVLSQLTPVSLGILDSGPLAIAMTAGDKFSIGVTVGGVGCAPFAGVTVTATYQ